MVLSYNVAKDMAKQENNRGHLSTALFLELLFWCVLFSITDLGGIMDIVSSLRGAEALLYDLYDYPEEVRAFTRRVKDLWFEGYQKQIETIKATGQPYNNWMNIPSKSPGMLFNATFAP